MSASPRSTWPSRSRASRIACASACDTLQPRKRTDAVAAADGEHTSPLEPHEQLEAEPGRRMSTGPERLSWVDDDGGQLRRRLLPGRADPERPDDGRDMKPLPLVLPAGSDRAARDGA